MEDTPRTRQSIPTSPKPIPSEAGVESSGNDNFLTPQPPRQQNCAPTLSPADCLTLQKILKDVCGPVPTSSPLRGMKDESMISVAKVDEESGESGEEKHDEVGDEAEDGYEDEDDSMEFSDATEHERDGGDDEEGGVGIMDEDGDTIEDIMNLPGQTAPPAPPQDFGRFHTHDHTTPDETKEIKRRRATIEMALEDERLDQERRILTAIESDILDRELGLDGQDDAVNLSDDPEFQAVQAIQAEIGMSVIADEEPGELELVETYGRRESRHFSPMPAPRRASEDSLLPLSPSSIAFSDYEPAVIQTPGGHHIAFAPNAAIPDTPFASTLKYFRQQHRGKENSPSKSRRNASLPEELAELAREAEKEEQLEQCLEADDEEEEEDLDKYREMDLAPLDPVMKSENAGDLITLGTPSKPPASTNDLILLEDCTSSTAGQPPPCTTSALPLRLSLPREQDTEDDADAEDSDTMSDRAHKQLINYPQHPTFVTVIEMLPAALFWATAAPAVRFGNKVYDTLIEKLTGLKVGDDN